ncbi:MAG: protealysin inhibitor emfourin [Chthoniobacteraceae bacterium]
MATLHVERIGGLAGFGGARSHVRSHGQLDAAALSAAENQAVEALFRTHGKAEASQVRDGFHYRISRTTPSGTETVEAPESEVPPTLMQCVKDELV